ncbi:MAG: squalene/phytoene synthase family protein [Pseudomonadota bacterium]
MTPLDHCAALVAEADPDRFRSAMTAPVTGRARLLPLYAAFAEIARAPWVSQEPMIGLMRLQFWQDGLGEICAGRPPRAHPVMEALAPVVADAGLEVDGFETVIAARRSDRDPAHPADTAALHAYLEGSAAKPMELAVRVLSDAQVVSTARDAALAAAQGIGFASGAANLLRALPALAARGVLPLPELGRSDLAALLDGRTTTALADAIGGLGAQAHARHRAGLAAARSAPRVVYPALRSGWRAGWLLRRACRGGDVLRDLGSESEFRRRAGLAWRELTGRV